jgi:hypothetical protein
MKIGKTVAVLSLAWISILAGFNVHAADPSICNPGVDVVYHSNGALKSCQLKYEYTANSVRCKSDYPVSFYTNGRLESCVLSAAATITGINCAGNGEIAFYMNGNVRSCMKGY